MVKDPSRSQEAARKANARIEIVEMNSIALDLDLPEDLEFLKIWKKKNKKSQK
jgi:2-phospho-L-lactate guanylyltransferase (CobY/MobA/RfbA family)